MYILTAKEYLLGIYVQLKYRRVAVVITQYRKPDIQLNTNKFLVKYLKARNLGSRIR
jgi:hypothetical protein